MRERVFFHYLLYITYPMEIEKIIKYNNQDIVSIMGLDHYKSEQNLAHLV